MHIQIYIYVFCICLSFLLDIDTLSVFEVQTTLTAMVGRMLGPLGCC